MPRPIGVGKPWVSVELQQSFHAPFGEVDVEPAIAVVITDGHARREFGLAVVEGDAAREGLFAEGAVALVHEKVVAPIARGLRHEVEVAVVVDVDPRGAGPVGSDSEASLDCDVREGSVFLVVEEQGRPGRATHVEIGVAVAVVISGGRRTHEEIEVAVLLDDAVREAVEWSAFVVRDAGLGRHLVKERQHRGALRRRAALADTETAVTSARARSTCGRAGT